MNGDVNHTRYSNDAEPWTQTDDDSFQLRRKVMEDVYELYQIQMVRPFEDTSDEKLYKVAQGFIHIKGITPKDRKNILECYGYSSIDELYEQYGDDWKGILAECWFELKAGCGIGLIDSPDMTWDESKSLICKCSGFAL